MKNKPIRWRLSVGKIKKLPTDDCQRIKPYKAIL